MKYSALVSYQIVGTFHRCKPQELWRAPFNPLTLQLICLMYTVSIPTSPSTLSFRRTDRSVKLIGQITI